MHLYEAFRQLIDIELEGEKIKQSLSLKADFNIFDAFKIFDRY